MIKALFFDIDGTLVSFSTHKIPASTIRAISLAKRKGIRIYISTGRPFSLIDNIDEISPFVDGYITANGAYCFIGEQVVACNPIPVEAVSTLIRLSDEMDFACMVVGEKDLTMHNANEAVDRIFRQMLNVQKLKDDVPIEKVSGQRILQLTPVITPEEERLIMPFLAGCVSSRWCPEFADITAYGVDKGNGLSAIASYTGLDVSETMAFGDGGNDIPILRKAGIGVAMGNSGQALKEAADYVTDSVDEDGVFNALVNKGII